MQCPIASGNKHALKLLHTKELPLVCMHVCFSILLFLNPLIPDDGFTHRETAGA